MYFGYPLGFMLKYLVKGTLPRHIFSIVTGFLLQLYMFREQFIHPLIMTAVVYLLMNVLPRNQQHKAILVFVMGYLSSQHIYRMITNFGGWDMDITTYTMILTAKLSALGFCYRDGGEKDTDLLPEQVENKVVKMPSVIEILSYVYFSSGCICGPFFEYSDYVMFIEKRGRYQNIPSTVVPSLIKFLKGKRKIVTL